MSSGVFFAILNVVKNLAVSTNAERLVSLEILRFAQDDRIKYRHCEELHQLAVLIPPTLNAILQQSTSVSKPADTLCSYLNSSR